MKKRWIIEYDHKDGRKGTIEAVTQIVKGEGFQYGNGKMGVLKIEGNTNGYDLRYNRSKDLHMVMIKEYFGEGLVNAKEIEEA